MYIIIVTRIDQASQESFSRMGLCLPNVTFIGSRAFENCTSLRRIVLPDGIVLDTKCLSNCDRIKEISVPGDLIYNSIENDCYYGRCKSKFYVGKGPLPFKYGIYMIQSYYFGECESLESVEIRPIKKKVGFEVIFIMLHHIVMLRPLIATKPCMNDDVYPFDLALMWLVSNESSFWFHSCESRDLYLTKGLYMFLRNFPTFLNKYIVNE